MNFINGTLKADKDAFLFSEIQGGTMQVRLPGVGREAARDWLDKPVLLGIRPEDIELAQFAGTETSTASFPAIVDIVEPMGAETNLYLQTGAHTVVCRSQRPLDHREAGHRFQFEMSLKKAHLFDPTSGRRVV
jgi:multiple sugar transport system ATP-binding protein